ncbi:MAG: TrmH family RNA methyltransferase [Flavobacteriaceae bacterium]|nr:TrmH family RNA methyltransferase [Flavobacteriaceae bacterium]
MQLTHYNSEFEVRTFPITLVCDGVTNAPNIGSLFRIADAFGIEKIIFCGGHISMDRKMKKTSRATEKVVNYEIQEDIISVLEGLKNSNHEIMSLEITSDSKSLNDIEFNTNKPIVLVVGDENFGVSNEVLKMSNEVFHINMFGKNSSMNVVQATNIALYEMTKQLM